jgi:iron complex outermembrane receptor protein
MFSRKVVVCVLAVALGARAPARAAAAPAEGEAALASAVAKGELVEEILVKGEKQTRVETMEVREVRETPAHDLGEALSQQGLAAGVRKGGTATDVVLRGFQRDNLAVTIDGAKIHGACPNRMDPPAFHVDYAEVDRVELRKGPYDVASQGGVGGTIDVRTRDPGVGPSGELNLGLGAFGSLEGSGTLGYGTARIGGTLGLAYKQADAFESGDGIRFTEIYPATSANRYRAESRGQTAYEMKTGWAKVAGAPAEGRRAELSFARQEANHVFYPYLKMDARSDDATRANALWETGALGPLSRTKAQAYFTHVKHDMDDAHRCSSWAAPSDCSTVLANGWSMRTAAESWVAGGLVEAAFVALGETVVGVDLSVRGWSSDTTRYMRGGTPGYFTEASIPDVTTSNVGLRAQHDVGLGERVKLRAGLRLDLVRSDPGVDRSAEYAKYYAALPSDLTRDDVLLSGNVQADVRLTDTATAFAGYGHGARVPDPQERFFALSGMVTPAGWSAGTVGSPTLDPVQNDEVDLGVKWSSGPVLVKAQVFRSWLGDYVAAVNVPQLADPTRGAKSYANVSATIDGGEASARLALPWDLYASAAVSYTEGWNRTAHGWLAEIPPLRGTVALRYDRARWFAEVESALAADQDKVDASAKEQPTAGWAILNVKAGLQLGGARVHVGVRNVADRAYYEHLSYLRDPFASGVRVPEPGRVAYANVQVGP